MTLATAGIRHTGPSHNAQHNDPCMEGSFKGLISVAGVVFGMFLGELSRRHTESAANGSVLTVTIENSNADKILFIMISAVAALAMWRAARSNPLDAGHLLKLCTVLFVGGAFISGHLMRSNIEVLADLKAGIVPRDALVSYYGRDLPYKLAPHTQSLRGSLREPENNQTTV